MFNSLSVFVCAFFVENNDDIQMLNLSIVDLCMDGRNLVVCISRCACAVSTSGSAKGIILKLVTNAGLPVSGFCFVLMAAVAKCRWTHCASQPFVAIRNIDLCLKQ